MMIQAHNHPPVAAAGNADDQNYALYLQRVRNRFARAAARGPLFRTDASLALWDEYLAAYPENVRQYHRCNACRAFFIHFGGLVTVNDDGTLEPAVFNEDDADPGDSAAIAMVEKIIRRAKITGPFLSEVPTLGTPQTRQWAHVSLTLPPALIHRGRVHTAHQAACEKVEDFKNVRRALFEFKAPVVAQALSLLKSDSLFRGEKVIGPAQFLQDLHAASATHRGERFTNILWREVAKAPAGFCHPRSSMIGTLLDDLVAGTPIERAAESFRRKMDPLHYQRPQAAPSAGNIARAEKLVEQLGIGPSLKRRFARLEEIQTIWKTVVETPAEAYGGIFGHLKTKNTPLTQTTIPGVKAITWAKFIRDVLPGAKQVDALVPAGAGPFFGMLTAEHADAPPILQWDREERRNPFSWYTYRGGSPAIQWGIVGGGWHAVTAFTLNPADWFGETLKHQGGGALAIVKGCRDTRHGQGNALFPEIMKSELHEIRATVEAYSKTAELGGRDEASACGLFVIGTTFRVTDGAGVAITYKIDRAE